MSAAGFDPSQPHLYYLPSPEIVAVSDAQLVAAGGAKLPVHIAYLAAVSPVLLNAFTVDGVGKKRKRVSVTGRQPAAATAAAACSAAAAATCPAVATGSPCRCRPPA